MSKTIIDVSGVAQGVIDWSKVSGNVDGAIIQCGYGSDLVKQDDKQFKANADACIKYGIPFGVYLYSYAKTVEQAKSEAAHVLRLVDNYRHALQLPIYYDLEEPGTEAGAVERALVFGDAIEGAGYWCGMYANEYWFKSIIGDKLDRFTKWVAKYGKNTGKPGKAPDVPGVDIWQYSSVGKVPGINGNVDMNIQYRDFDINAGTVKAPEETKSIEEIACEVIDGKWGNGADRQDAIEAAGYSYSAVQQIVNMMLSTKTYTVKSGDSLWSIALSQMGNGSRYGEIKTANGLTSDVISVGQVLTIPN